MIAEILSVLLALPPAWVDRVEEPDTRRDRLAVAASAIATYARDPIEASLMIASGTHESRWAAYIGLGACHKGPPGQRCDRMRSRGYWQPQRRTCPAAWVSDPVAAVYGGAECAARLFRAGRSRCGTIEGAFLTYNGSHSCVSRAKWLRNRLGTFWYAYSRLSGFRAAGMHPLHTPDMACTNDSAEIRVRYDRCVIGIPDISAR